MGWRRFIARAARGRAATDGADGGAARARPRRRRWAAAALGALALAALWWLLVRESAPATLDVDITDTPTPGSPVTHLRIPRPYFFWAMMPDAREEPLVELVAYLPGLLSEKDAKRAGYPTVREVVNGIKLPSDNQVFITVEQSVPDLVNKFFHVLTARPEVKFDGARDGTYQVYTITKKNFSGNYFSDPLQGEYLGPIGRDNLFIECGSLNMSPDDTGCEVYTQFSDKLEMRFSVTRSRLAEWPSVEEKVKKLVASFVVE